MRDYDLLFAEYDIYYPSKIPGFISWGKNGVIILNKVKEIFAIYLKTISYSEIILPVVCCKDDIDRYLNDKKTKTVGACFDTESKLVLAPFSDLLYVDHIVCNFLNREKHILPHKDYTWSMCYIKEANPNYANQCAYYQCESFSLHSNKEDAQKTWHTLNGCFKNICENELDLSPVYGYRPRVSVFPFSECSFVAEICKENTTFFTLLVSHIMKANFMADNGFERYKDLILISSSFSQKLLTWMLIHHSDEYGFRFPPALAPIEGIINFTDNMEMCRYLNIINENETIKYFYDISDIQKTMLVNGAIWALQQIDEGNGIKSWLLWKRGEINSKQSKFDDFYAALLCAKNYIAEFKAQLKLESSKKTASSLFNTYSMRDLSELIKKIESNPLDQRNNICVPFCNSILCQNDLVRSVKWTPKIFYEQSYDNKCVICDKYTKGILMFEKTEVYPGFYANEPG